MSQSRYVEGIVAKYTVSTDAGSLGYNAAIEIRSTLASWAGSALNEIYLSGSYAKRTSIRGEADIDLLISIVPQNIQTMSDLYWSLFTYLQNRGYAVRKQDVSIGVTYKNARLDLIPAKKYAGNTNDHAIFSTRRDSWTKTNIEQHIKEVIDSGRATDIKAGKVWKRCHNLEFPSFYLELSVLKSLSGRIIDEHSSNFLIFLTYLRDSFVDTKIVDPANSNNVVSDDLTRDEKKAISNKAAACLAERYWEEIVW